MATTHSFSTPCGHEATVKPCQSKKGPNAGKWVVNIRGKNVILKSGIKTKYCEPSQDAAKQAIASFLGISKSLVTTGNSGAVKNEETKRKVTSAAIMASVPSVSTNAALNPPPPLALTTSSYPGMFMPPYAFPPQFPGGAAFGPRPPVFGNGVAMMPFHAGVFQTSMANVGVPQASLNASSLVPSDSMVNAGVSQAPSNAAFLPPAAQLPQQQQQQASMSNGNVIVPTFEQERIYQHAKPPTPLDTNFIVRITAGAGAGKTTTVLQVAAKAARSGHSHITYVTFAKAAAADGARRIQEALSDFPNPPTIEARTLHSCAMKLLSDERKETFEEENKRLMDDEALQAFIKTTCYREIQDFLAHAKEEIASRTKEDLRMRASMLEAAERQVVFFIFKTFGLFCRSPYTVQQFKDPMFKYRNYYPAEKFHQTNADGEKQGFPSMVYKFKFGQYADWAGLVWEAATEQGLRSYDMEMKRAQLKALRIPGSLLLVDESQDMDGCQVDWISKQVNNGAHVYFVGDAAQTIYSFRGAKSKYMVNLKRAVDFELTTSWRFGSNIASVANVVLYSKHKSKQTQRDNATWQPYRVKGGGSEGIVTTETILPKWKEMPITVLAAFNATLLNVAVSMLGMNVDSDANEDGSSNEEADVKTETDSMKAVTQSEANPESAPIVSDDAASLALKTDSTSEDAKPPTNIVAPVDSETLLPISFPKIHINGEGENSGIRKWQLVLKQIQHIYDLYKSGDDGHVLPARSFKEFKGLCLTWSSFCSQVESRELTKYAASVHVVKTFGDKTMDVIALFEREVMDKKYSVEDSDVILSTTHAAKGMEWANVQVCDDFVDLFKLSCDGPLTAKRGGAGSDAKRYSWQFHIKKWGDDANLLYVACTRAKKLLSIPTSIKRFLQDCDMLHDMIRCKKLFRERDMTKNSDIVVFGSNKPLSVGDALDVYLDIVFPLRMENKLQTKDRLMKALVKPLEGEADYDGDVDKTLAGDDEFEQFFGCQKKPPLATAVKRSVATPNITAAKSEVTAAESAAKKPKLSRAHYIMDEAKAAAALAPKGTKRPYDKNKEIAARKAGCKECGKEIEVGSTRVGVQVYKPDRSEFWCSYFHDKCFPKELVPQLRLDPNPNHKKPTAAKKSWNGKKSYGGDSYKYSSRGGGWRSKGGYRKHW